ncbi:MAG TPA: hypothetical protein VGD91_30965, partial [Trebonia sp.]
MAAVWIAADLAGAVALPQPAEMRRQVAEQLAFMDVATDNHHCHGGKIIPFGRPGGLPRGHPCRARAAAAGAAGGRARGGRYRAGNGGAGLTGD